MPGEKDRRMLIDSKRRSVLLNFKESASSLTISMRPMIFISTTINVIHINTVMSQRVYLVCA